MADVDYRKLWKKLIDKGIKNKTDLITMADISSNVLAKLGKGEFISMESIQKICKALNCDVGDICVMNNVEGAE
ncbi:DNA-binding transcriptional regulator, XRE family [Treponema berlinense]|uniref:DNA-binding transcriptional regulator, XRE family n=1 Tax=Treponema berlinense TaxID=225004 RepID=A0A1T4KKX0_9SPIR|nr:helix-turn-helix transcriptional regulator [Treponema berlinense]SJZ43038.1 DNA-binding transcriptional regulator, XRE family [Treponema berlinense]